jgi:hypothetical protein
LGLEVRLLPAVQAEMMALTAFFLVLQLLVGVVAVRIRAGVPPMVEAVVLAAVLRILELPVLGLQDKEIMEVWVLLVWHTPLVVAEAQVPQGLLMLVIV